MAGLVPAMAFERRLKDAHSWTGLIETSYIVHWRIPWPTPGRLKMLLCRRVISAPGWLRAPPAAKTSWCRHAGQGAVIRSRHARNVRDFAVFGLSIVDPWAA